MSQIPGWLWEHRGKWAVTAPLGRSGAATFEQRCSTAMRKKEAWAAATQVLKWPSLPKLGAGDEVGEANKGLLRRRKGCGLHHHSDGQRTRA